MVTPGHLVVTPGQYSYPELMVTQKIINSRCLFDFYCIKDAQSPMTGCTNAAQKFSTDERRYLSFNCCSFGKRIWTKFSLRFCEVWFSLEPWVSSLVFPLVCINQLRFTKLATYKIFCCDTRVESNDSLHGKKEQILKRDSGHRGLRGLRRGRSWNFSLLKVKKRQLRPQNWAETGPRWSEWALSKNPGRFWPCGLDFKGFRGLGARKWGFI